MRKAALPWTVLLLAGCGAGTPSELSNDPSTLAFVGANVIPMDREVVLADQTVIVQGGRIAALGPSSEVPVPDGARQIEATGRYLMPGLADMHAHIWNEDYFWLFLANGVTQIRNMWGAPIHLRWKAEIEAGERVAPSIYTVGPLMDGPGSFWPGSTILRTPEEARAAVAEVQAAGFPAVKVYSSLSAEVYTAIVESCRRLGLRVEGHVPISVGIDRAIEAGQIANEHLRTIERATRRDGSPYDTAWDRLPWIDRRKKLGELGRRIQRGEVAMDDVHDPQKIAALAARIADSAMWNIPTLTVFKAMPAADTRRALEAPEMRYLDPEARNRWLPENSYFAGSSDEQLLGLQAWAAYRRSVVFALHEAGAGILLGSDTMNPLVVPGFSVHEELQELVAAGLTPYEALRAGTSEAARFLDETGEWGVVAAGARADLVLLEGNPLEDVSEAARPLGVMVRGLWLPAAELQERLEDLAAAHAGE